MLGGSKLNPTGAAVAAAAGTRPAPPPDSHRHLPALPHSMQMERMSAERSMESLQQQVEHLTNELGFAQVCLDVLRVL